MSDNSTELSRTSLFHLFPVFHIVSPESPQNERPLTFVQNARGLKPAYLLQNKRAADQNRTGDLHITNAKIEAFHRFLSLIIVAI